VATGASRKEEFLTFCMETGTFLRRERLIGCRSLAGATRVHRDPSGEASKGDCEEKSCGSSVHGRITFYSR
jgi:hypothetical protein